MTPLSAAFEVRSFYKGGGLCIHTWHRDRLSRDMEIAASKSRKDIGRIEWRPAHVNAKWEPVQ